jgi:hypothetical protein
MTVIKTNPYFNLWTSKFTHLIVATLTSEPTGRQFITKHPTLAEN